VLDDASSDETPDVVQEFTRRLEQTPQGQHISVRYVRSETNIGQFANWNRALDLCRTELLNVFHDDDVMFPWMLEDLTAALDEHPECGIALSLGNAAVAGSPPPAAEARPSCSVLQGKEYAQELRTGDDTRLFHVAPPSGLLRVAEVRRIGLRWREDVGPCADSCFWLEASDGGIPICLLGAEKPLLARRQHPGSITASSGMRAWTVSFKHLYDLIVELNPDVGKLANLRRAMMLSGIHAALEWDTFSTPDAAARTLSNIRDAAECIRELNWASSDEEIAVYILKPFVKRALTGQMSFTPCIRLARLLNKDGFRVSPTTWLREAARMFARRIYRNRKETT
jgi:hypothetical protein